MHQSSYMLSSPTRHQQPHYSFRILCGTVAVDTQKHLASAGHMAAGRFFLESTTESAGMGLVMEEYSLSEFWGSTVGWRLGYTSLVLDEW